MEGTQLVFYIGEWTFDDERVGCHGCLISNLKRTSSRLHWVVSRASPLTLKRQVGRPYDDVITDQLFHSASRSGSKKLHLAVNIQTSSTSLDMLQ